MDFYNKVLGVLFILLLIVGIGLYYYYDQSRELRHQIEEYAEQNEELGNEVAELRERIEEMETEETEQPVSDIGEISFRPFSDFDLRRFEQKGIEDPISFLRDQVQDNPELIPTEPVLGGTMSFYDRDAIQVLNDRWVLATYEDGHISGQILLEYDIDEEGEISWEVLDVTEP